MVVGSCYGKMAVDSAKVFPDLKWRLPGLLARSDRFAFVLLRLPVSPGRATSGSLTAHP
jgi:hypothetical protein